MSRVLITDGDQRAALAVVRSLGRAGYPVYVCSSRARSLAGASRYCSGEARVPDPLAEPDAFMTGLAALVGRWGIETLLPMSEAALTAVLPKRTCLPNVRIPFPPAEAFTRICDKSEVMAEAVRVGIRIPAQVRLQQPHDIQAAGSISFPAVVKPSRSVIGDGTRRAKTMVAHVASEAALRQVLEELPAAAYPVLVQERILGPGVGVFVLMEEGRATAAFAHQRIREKPPSGGVSVYRESAPLDPDLLERTVALLNAFGWSGVAMVEYKVQAETGTPFIMEINGRFWGSLQLAVDAGVDFPLWLLEGAPQPGLPPYVVGVRSRWEWGDVDHLLTRLTRSARQLALPPGAPGRFRTFGAFIAAFFGRSRAEILRPDDPRPFLRETLDRLRPR